MDRRRAPSPSIVSRRRLAALIALLAGAIASCGVGQSIYVLDGGEARVVASRDGLPEEPQPRVVLASDIPPPPPLSTLPESSATEYDAAPSAVQLTPSVDHENQPSLQIDARDTHQLTLRLTPLTLGEALAFLHGGQVFTRQGKTLTLNADEVPDRVQARVDLTTVEGWERGLLAADAETLSRDGERLEQSQLLQISPIDVRVTPRPSQLQLTVTERGAATAIVGAVVELLDADGRVLATGQTDAAGALTLERPQVVVPALLGEGLYLSVRHLRRQALIPL